MKEVVFNPIIVKGIFQALLEVPMGIDSVSRMVIVDTGLLEEDITATEGMDGTWTSQQ